MQQQFGCVGLAESVVEAWLKTTTGRRWSRTTDGHTHRPASRSTVTATASLSRTSPSSILHAAYSAANALPSGHHRTTLLSDRFVLFSILL